MPKPTVDPYIPPNHWSRREPDGLCHFERLEQDGTLTTWRAPFPAKMSATPYAQGGPMQPVKATRHEHTTECLVPVTDVAPEGPARPGENTLVHMGGEVTWDVWRTRVGCKVLRLPVFSRAVQA